MTTTEQALEAARRLARRAAQRRAGAGACPYPADGNPLQQACRRAWIRTYTRMRPAEAVPVDYGDDLTALAEGPDSGDTDDGQVGTPAAAAAAVAQGTIIGRGGGR
ncbi:hypothetical protein ACIBTV_27845 [Micromonospora sp. NPDC049366]|uniref:hypothetical protein n=1 Tax=Micromonospora sp. NPDC049366 TaxID=3364271 RepID=UPI003798498B